MTRWYLVEPAELDAAPEVFLVLDAVPAQLLGVHVELGEVLLVPPLAGVVLLAVVGVDDGEDVGDLGHLVVQDAPELPAGLLLVVLVGVPQHPQVHQRVDADLLELELEAAHC